MCTLMLNYAGIETSFQSENINKMVFLIVLSQVVCSLQQQLAVIMQMINKLCIGFVLSLYMAQLMAAPMDSDRGREEG